MAPAGGARQCGGSLITRWSLSNFKSVRQADLEMGALNVFVGANSSGKTAILQSMLLLRQTLENKLSERPLILNGSLVQLGTFDDVKHEASDAATIGIGFELSPTDDAVSPSTSAPPNIRRPYSRAGLSQLSKISVELEFTVSEATASKELLQLQPSLHSMRLEAHQVEPEEKSASVLIAQADEDPDDRARELDVTRAHPAYIRGLAYEVLSAEGEDPHDPRVEFEQEFPVGCTLNHFLPKWLVAPAHEGSRLAQRAVEVLLDPLGIRGQRLARRWDLYLPTSVLDMLRGRLGPKWQHLLVPSERKQLTLWQDTEPDYLHLADWVERTHLMSHRLRRQLADELEPMAHDIRSALQEEYGDLVTLEQYRLPLLDEAVYHVATSFLDRIKYLGPLRTNPKALYPLSTPSDPFDVGLAGENTAAVLDLFKDRVIRHMDPSSFTGEGIRPRFRGESLAGAVGNWLRYLGVADRVITRDRGKLGHELKVAVEQGAGHHDLTHVGVGVSQCLPIVVMCLIAPTSSTLILEQPELHLHPRVQGRLADFFLALALSGQQCVIETHSEYLINRLRYRIASTMDSDLHDLVRTFFVDKVDGASSCRRVRVNRFGVVEDWPSGFFDESQIETERLLQAAARRFDVEGL